MKALPIVFIGVCIVLNVHSQEKKGLLYTVRQDELFNKKDKSVDTETAASFSDIYFRIDSTSFYSTTTKVKIFRSLNIKNEVTEIKSKI